MIRPVDPKLIFEVIQDELGHFSARCINARISTGGADLSELHDNLTAAIEAHFPGEEPPAAGEVHLVMADDNGLQVTS